MPKRLTITLSMALLFAVISSAQPLLTKPQLVTTEWLAQHLKDPNIRIVDARPSLRDYIDGFIPNAVYLNTETLRISLGGIPARLLPAERLAEIFSAIGIGKRHTVVVYSSGNDAFAHATYIAFALEFLGHRSIGVLDGGFEKWRSEGRPVTREFPKIPPTRFIPKVNEQIKVDWLTVWKSLRGKGAQILDARSPKDYAESHIPTARNAFLRENLQGDKVLVWKSPNEIAEGLKRIVDLKKPIITYCNSGREASQLWFTLRHILGIPNVALYEGSWVEWSARKLPKE